MRPMKLEDFRIGSEFYHRGKRWRCTDVGTRTVVAMALEPHADPTGKVRYLRKERAARADLAKARAVLDGVPDVSSVPRDEL